MLAGVRCGSWSCKNVLVGAIDASPFGEMSFPNLAAFRSRSVLIELPAVLGCAATADGRMSAATMPSSPPRAAGCP